MFFSSSFRCCYLTIGLVRSPIVGCEGKGVRHLYSHRRKLLRRFSNFRKGLDRFIEGNVEGHRGTTIIFIEGSLLKRPIFEGHDCVFRGNERGYPRGARVKVCLIDRKSVV